MASPAHTAPVFNTQKRREVLLWVTDQLRNINPEAIVVCGQSGMILGALVSDRLNIPLVVVRKKWEEPRAASFAKKVTWDGDNCYDSWVFLDDLIGTGETFETAAEQAFEAGAISTKTPCAILLYAMEMIKWSKYPEIPMISHAFWMQT